MKKEFKIFILLEKILNALNNSRLEYLKAADKSPYPEYKRFLNKTATTRNKFYQDLMAVLRSHYGKSENPVLNKIDYIKIVTNPYKNLKTDHLEIILNLDLKLVELYEEITKNHEVSGILNEQLDQILDCVKINKNKILDKQVVFYH